MELGKTNTLKIARSTDNGCYLADEDGNEVLLPNAYVSTEMKLGDEISVFVYKDNLQRPVATTLKPKVEIDQFAYLQIKEVNNTGAFADMGVVKQLMIPFKEQAVKMEEGQCYVIFMFLDEETDRLIGSSKLSDFIFYDKIEVEEGDEVEILCYKKTDLGVSAIVNNMFDGLIFHSDIHQRLNVGDQTKAYVKKVREDGKIDLVLAPMGYRNNIDTFSQKVLDHLKNQNGTMTLTDKSNPEEIYRQLGMSKKAFKKALGFLYKSKMVELNPKETKLIV